MYIHSWKTILSHQTVSFLLLMISTSPSVLHISVNADKSGIYLIEFSESFFQSSNWVILIVDRSINVIDNNGDKRTFHHRKHQKKYCYQFFLHRIKPHLIWLSKFGKIYHLKYDLFNRQKQTQKFPSLNLVKIYKYSQCLFIFCSSWEIYSFVIANSITAYSTQGIVLHNFSACWILW